MHQYLVRFLFKSYDLLQIVFIPVWIVMCVALIGVLYAIILAIILLKSPDIIPEQRRGNVFSAVGYTCLVVPLLVFQVRQQILCYVFNLCMYGAVWLCLVQKSVYSSSIFNAFQKAATVNWYALVTSFQTSDENLKILEHFESE